MAIALQVYFMYKMFHNLHSYQDKDNDVKLLAHGDFTRWRQTSAVESYYRIVI